MLGVKAVSRECALEWLLDDLGAGVLKAGLKAGLEEVGAFGSLFWTLVNARDGLDDGALKRPAGG